jgi:hypothetical protein
MGKIGGLVAVAVLGLTGCSSATTERVANVQPAASVQSEMLAELRPLLKTLQASDADLISEGFGACMSLVFQSKDTYREGVLRQYGDLDLALDHLTVAAAAKQHLCR